MGSPDDKDVHPWERQDGEPDTAYQAFQGYFLQVPPRRMAHASVRHSTAELSRLYNEWRWEERATAYDRHVQRIRQAERDAMLQQDEKERLAKMVAVLETTGEIISREMAKLLRDSLATEASGLVRPGDLNKLLGQWVTLQRLIHGESTENVATVDARLENLTPEELRTLRELHEKLAGDSSDDTRH